MISKLCFLLLTCCILHQINAEEKIDERIFFKFKNPSFFVNGIDFPFTAQESFVLSRIVTNVLARQNSLFYKNFVFLISNAQLRNLLTTLNRNGQNNLLETIIAAIIEQTPPSICVNNTLLKIVLDILNLPNKTYINKIAPIILKECFSHDLGEICSPFGTTNLKLLKEKKYAELRNNLTEAVSQKTFCN